MSLSPGATNGPVDMSVSVTITVTEAAILAFMLGSLSAATSLQNRLLSIESSCEQNGAPTASILFSPLEQGFVMGALAPAACQFSVGLRGRVQNAMTEKLKQLGASVG